MIIPELAESWEISDDKKTYIFHLRKDATFHDGAPVTAYDVKWSFDRAIAAGGFPAVQMAAGSLVERRTVFGGRRPHLQGHLRQAEQADHAGPRGAGAGDRELEAREEARNGSRPVGVRVDRAQ